MNCLECQELLQRCLDGESVDLAEELGQHWNECATCRAQHAAALRLLVGLKALPKPRLAQGFAQALTARVLLDRRVRQDKMRRRVVVTVALAASVLLMLFAAYYWIPRDRQNEPGPKQDFVKQKETPPPKVPEQMKPPENGPAALPDRWADTMRDHAKVVMVAANLDGIDKMPQVDLGPMIDPGVREAGQEVSDGVRTVTRNARKAFDFFARELPMPELGDEKN